MKKPLRQLPVDLPCLPGVGCSVKLRHAPVAVADAFADLRSKVDGDPGHGREVLPQLPDAEACRSCLRKLVAKPEVVLRHARLSAPQRATLLEEAGGALPVEPCTALTWNVNQKLQPLSAQAPGDPRVWSEDDNFDAVQAEVLRLQPDVFVVAGMRFFDCGSAPC